MLADMWPARVQTSLATAELGQVHDAEGHAMDTHCDDAHDLSQGASASFTGEHVLNDTDIEAPNADPGHCPHQRGGVAAWE